MNTIIPLVYYDQFILLSLVSIGKHLSREKLNNFTVKMFQSQTYNIIFFIKVFRAGAYKNIINYVATQISLTPQ